MEQARLTLTYQQRRRLLAALASMALFNDRPGRSLLLVGLPQNLVGTIERANRYHALKEAYAAGQWPQVLNLAEAIAGYRDVAQLAAAARDELDRPRRLLEQLADAYGADDWERVLALADQLADNRPRRSQPGWPVPPRKYATTGCARPWPRSSGPACSSWRRA